MKQILDLLTVSGLRMSPVERVEGVNERQSGIGDATLNSVLRKTIALTSNQVGEEV